MTRYDQGKPRVPDVAGLSARNAAIAVRLAGLEPVALLKRFGSADPTARVEGSHPPSGATLDPGTRVELLPADTLSEDNVVLADEFPGWLVPDVVGVEAGDGMAQLRDAGFQPMQQTHFDDDHAEGLISATFPRGGTYVPVGGIFVTVSISAGPFPPPDPPERPDDLQTLPPFE